MDDTLNAAFTVLMGFAFHDDSPAASWFKVNKDQIASEYVLTRSGRYQQIERPEYAPIILEIQKLESPDVAQALTMLGAPSTVLVDDWHLSQIAARHYGMKEELGNGSWRIRYSRYQPKRPKVLQPGDEFHLIDLLDGTAVLPEGVKDFDKRVQQTEWVGFDDLDFQGYFKSIRDREYVYRIAPPKRKPLPSEVSALLDEVPEFKTRLTELGYDLGQPV